MFPAGVSPSPSSGRGKESGGCCEPAAPRTDPVVGQGGARGWVDISCSCARQTLENIDTKPLRTAKSEKLVDPRPHLRQHGQRGPQLEGRGEVFQREGGQPGPVLGLQGGGRHLGVQEGHQGGGQTLAQVTVQGGPVGREQPHLERGNYARGIQHHTTSLTLVVKVKFRFG